MTCAQLRTKTPTSISQKLCSLAHYFQIKARGHTYTKPMIRLPRAFRGRTAVRFPANSSHMCCLELALDRQLCTHLGSKRFLRRGFPRFINPTALSRWWTHISAKQLSLLRARYGCAHA